MKANGDDIGILALNVGSSSVKFGFYLIEDNVPVEHIAGNVESDADVHRITLKSSDDPEHVIEVETSSALEALCAAPEFQDLPNPSAIGHRVVHGGIALRRHSRIDGKILKQLEAASAFAPLHVPPALQLIRDAIQLFPAAAQIACLDTAFHNCLPDIARVLPLPKEILERGVERIGFHGLSCESVVHVLGARCPRRLVIAHLGSGCSITAVRDGKSVDTSMGLTPMGGVMMGTRPGDLDPGVLLYLLRTDQYSTTELESLLNRRAGLAGISGDNGDVRTLEVEAGANPHVALALNQFVRSVARHIAGMMVVLGGMDLLVFTGGVGEHSSNVRQRILGELLPLDSAMSVQVVPARENDCIARHCWWQMTD